MLADSSSKHHFLKKGFWLYLFTFLVAPLGYFVRIILSHDISVSQIGVIYGVISLIGLLSAYNDFGFTDSLNYFLPKFFAKNENENAKTTLFYAVVVQFFSSVIIAGGLYFGADILGRYYFNDADSVGVLKVLSLFFVGSNIFNLINTLFGVAQDTLLQKSTEFLRMFFVFASALIIFLAGKGSLLAYAWIWIIGLVVAITISVAFFYPKYYVPHLAHVPLKWNKPLFKTILTYAFWGMLTSNVATMLSQFDMQIIITVLTTKQAGYYANYLSLIGIPFIVVTPAIRFLLPVVSRMAGQENTKQLARVKYVFHNTFAPLAVSFSVFLFVFSVPVATFLFGAKFALSGEVLMYSVPFLIFNFLLQTNFQLLSAT